MGKHLPAVAGLPAPLPRPTITEQQLVLVVAAPAHQAGHRLEPLLELWVLKRHTLRRQRAVLNRRWGRRRGAGLCLPLPCTCHSLW